MIHLVIPLLGLLLYLGLIKKIKNERVKDPPTIDMFFIFTTYGGLLLLALTTFFWKWSGMASIGASYLVLVAPLIMGSTAFRNYKNKRLSKYHVLAYKIGLLYFLIAPLTLA